MDGEPRKRSPLGKEEEAELEESWRCPSGDVQEAAGVGVWNSDERSQMGI